MGVIKLSFQLIFYTLVVALALLVVPGIPPHLKFEPYSIRPARKLEGKLTPNDVLDRAELLVDGEFIGPESVAVRGDTVYTGIVGGHIIKIDGKGKWDKVATIPGECEGSYSHCPRPLGLRFTNEGQLLVADAVKGLYEVDVNSGKVEIILSSQSLLDDGEPLHFADDLDVDRDGIIYFSDASKVATMENPFLEAFGPPTGRLVKFNPKTKTSEVLITGIHFANGVQLSRKEDFVVVCETIRSRVLKYYLTGPKQGTKETFIEGLPGLPDNVRSNGKGGFYISLIMPDTQDVSHLGPFGDASQFKKVIIVDVDESGNIVGSLQNKNGLISSISEIGLGEKYTYFGSPYSNKFWRIKTEYLL